jgi:hypothetical protein
MTMMKKLVNEATPEGFGRCRFIGTWRNYAVLPQMMMRLQNSRPKKATSFLVLSNREVIASSFSLT